MHNGGTPAWWPITMGAVLVVYYGLALIGNRPAVQRTANALGVGRIVTWMALYPPWQSARTKRFGRVLTMTVGLALIVWGILQATR
jgi:hypothetical protein